MNQRGDPLPPGRAPANARVLVCFAVKAEARPFLRLAAGRPQWQVALMGMGPVMAARNLSARLAQDRPELVCTCGFAGGLNPDLAAGTVVFAADPGLELAAALTQAGAVPGRFCGVDRVLSTAAEKAALRRVTGADAIEMESSVIRSACRQAGLPSATIRVISDVAAEDLPVDFNRFLTPDGQLDYFQLAWVTTRAPRTWPAWWAFQRQTRRAAAVLAGVLASALIAMVDK